MCEPCSCLVRAAQNRSRGSDAFQMFKSPTWGPSGVERRKSEPAGTFQARPLRGGTVNVSFLIKSPSFRSRSFWYKAVGGCSGESAEVGKYAGAGGVLSGALVAIFNLWTIYRSTVGYFS